MYSRTNGDTLLHAAARYGSTEITKSILAKATYKNPKNKEGDTPLHEAAKRGFLEVLSIRTMQIRIGINSWDMKTTGKLRKDCHFLNVRSLCFVFNHNAVLMYFKKCCWIFIVGLDYTVVK